MSLFGTSGIRGDALKFFTNQFCFDIGRTFAKFLEVHLKPGAIAIGMDPRGTSPRIKRMVEEGLAFEEREIYDQGATPVPSMNYILQVSNIYAGSIMVTGSHIKDYLNGVKFFFNKEEILKEHEIEIENIYESIKNEHLYKSKNIEIHEEDIAKKEYIEMLSKLASSAYPKWKVVVDPGDGAQSDVMPQVLGMLGLDVVEMNATIQGKFWARDTEVEVEFEDLKQRVKKEKADFGVAYDSDGDRAIFVDENGHFIPGDYSASIIAREASGKIVVTPIATSSVVEHIGKKVYRTKVGSPYVVEAMKRMNAKIGFEANGGCIFSEIMYSRDGGSTTIKLLNILSKRAKKISSLIEELPKYYLAKTKLDYKWELMDTIYTKVREKYSDYNIEDMDGLKILISEDTWMLFRSSMNAPEFRIFAESMDIDKSKQLLDEGLNLVREVVNKNGKS